MAPPLSWRGDLDRPCRAGDRHLAPAVALARQESVLTRRHATVERGAGTLRFRAGPLRTPSWALLHTISSGTIAGKEEAARLNVRYEIRFTALLSVCAFGGVSVLWLDLDGMTTGPGMAKLIWVAVPMIAPVHAVDVAVGALRVFRLLGRTLDHAA